MEIWRSISPKEEVLNKVKGVELQLKPWSKER